MKKLYIFFSIIMLVHTAHTQQNESYELLWKQVQKLEEQTLTKSALAMVETISQKAEAEKNAGQSIKALLYKSKFALILEEEAQLGIITDFKAEIGKSDSPVKNILHSYLADLYRQYFQQNRYRFYSRTPTETKVDTADFRTWDLTTLFKAIDFHFEASLEQRTKLQQLPISQYQVILNEQENSKAYRPTLFDLLAHNALDFYTTSENSSPKPVDSFELDNPDLLCEAYTFSLSALGNTKPLSLEEKALKIYSQLIAFHYGKPDMKPLVQVDIERLHFIHNYAVFPGKDALYIKVLQNAAESIKSSPLSGLYTYEVAHFYQQLGTTYDPKTNTEHQWKLKKAIALCDSVIALFPASLGADKCKALKSQIKQPSIQITAEKQVPTNTPGRLLVNYKNYTTIGLTAHIISQKELRELEQLYPKHKKQEFISKLPIAHTWSATLKTVHDYQNHSTELYLPPLVNGSYAIMVKPAPNDEKIYSYSTMQATNLALIETDTETQQHYQVIDRTNGTPVPGAEVTLRYRTNYDGPLQRKILYTDDKGGLSVKRDKDNWGNLHIEIKKGQDEAYFGNYNINQGYAYNPDKGTKACFLFIDRSIYRPGQPLYFKGIVIERNGTSSNSIVGELITVGLYDFNDTKIAEIDLETNEFGSFSGDFILPSHGLTGAYYVKANGLSGFIDQTHYFSVEEYKRPTFETTFEPITDTYKVNDSIIIKGKATAYAGSSISNAKVVYRVKRIVGLPRWYYWSRPHFSGTPQEITNGETTTDASGNYKIIFKALPDTQIDKDNLPVFRYEISADVTDINGETRSTITVISVGYHALNIDLNIPETLDKHSKENTFSISSTNLNGAFVPATGQVVLYKLEATHYVLRPRSWPAPDYPGFTKEKFKELYPHEAFTNEDNPVNWERGKLVWSSSFNTGISKALELKDLKKWASGHYKMELISTDKFGQVVKEVALLNLTDSEDKKPADNQLFQVKLDKSQYSIGDEAKVTFRSSAENLTVSVAVEKNHKVVDSLRVMLNNNSKTIKIPVNAADLGGFTVHYSYAFQNHFESNNQHVLVPYPNSDLQIETLTFRDKIVPGTDQTWSFKVKGPNGDKVSAELLASMYDASLDQFKTHSWSFNPLFRPTNYSHLRSNAYNSFSINNFNTYQNYKYTAYASLAFDSFNWFGLHLDYRGAFFDERTRKMSLSAAPDSEIREAAATLDEVIITDTQAATEQGANFNRTKEVTATDEKLNFDSVLPRTNLQETAFFLPHLLTDKDGNVSFNFTTPEALTRWNLQLLAHTKTLEHSIKNYSTITQKELMVLPNAPRFLREGDSIVLSSKISNLTDKSLVGVAQLELSDGLTGKDISQILISPSQHNTFNKRTFQVDSLGNTQVSWSLMIPQGLQAVQYKIVAKAGDFSDGEQFIVPVLTNRTLVTETMPMWIRSNQTKSFTLEKLREKTASTRTHHKLTLEITSNPAWYAVQTLPYLMEYPYECNEQTFAKYYANTLASQIANSNPRIKEVFKQWANSGVLTSTLEKNEELKSLMIQETPWLRDAQSETEQKKRIGLLFNLNKMKNEQELALTKLGQNQKSNGAWAWFHGGPDNRYVTQHIVSGFGHLKHLNLMLRAVETQNTSIIKNALVYLDAAFIKEYEEMKKGAANFNDDHLSVSQIQFLYMRSFFNDVKTSKKVNEIIAYYKKQAQTYWIKKGLQSQGMLALVLHRMDDSKTANSILRSLQENSITSNELGMYWKKNTNSWNWHQAPIETQALLIEAFSEIHPTDTKTIDNLKIWLLKNKQANQWPTTKATTEALYALLLQGSDWLSITDAVEVFVGDKKIEPNQVENVKMDAGTGYFKTSWNSNAIQPKMAKVELRKKGEGMAWGALYWQYFEDLDKITGAETPLKLKKKIFLKKNTDTGETLVETTDNTRLTVGDLVRISIELRVDRDMEFIHMKDMRAAGFEPINVRSQYKWQDGLGYYESTKDASTNFFFDYLPKGIYVFEYDVRVNNAGALSNGITTIQSMYAPEFSSHSNGVRVKVNSLYTHPTPKL